jgi:hypothetical protein
MQSGIAEYHSSIRAARLFTDSHLPLASGLSYDGVDFFIVASIPGLVEMAESQGPKDCRNNLPEVRMIPFSLFFIVCPGMCWHLGFFVCFAVHSNWLVCSPYGVGVGGCRQDTEFLMKLKNYEIFPPRPFSTSGPR